MSCCYQKEVKYHGFYYKDEEPQAYILAWMKVQHLVKDRAGQDGQWGLIQNMQPRHQGSGGAIAQLEYTFGWNYQYYFCVNVMLLREILKKNMVFRLQNSLERV